MAHGTPDFWGAAPKGTTYGLADMSELAVRLGSFVNYDRRGDVIWADGFDQGGAGYLVTGSGVGTNVYLSCSQVNHGGLCLVLKTGAAEGTMSQVEKAMRYPVLGGVGLEISFVPDTKTALVLLGILLYDGANQTGYTVGYDHATGKINVYDHLGAATLIGTPGLLRDTYSTYSQFKMVINCLTGKYMRAMINEHTYDASACGGDVIGSGTIKSMVIYSMVTCGSGGYSEVRVDNMIVTQNEPV